MINVVIADDEIRICKLIKALVDWESLGMQIVGEAHNGIEALELIYATAPDIVITDIRMPGLTGLELIEKAKAQNINIEFIIISGYAHFEYAQSAIKFGVSDYLLKPVNKIELISTLEKMREKHMARKELRFSSEQLEKQNNSDKKKIRANYILNLFRNNNSSISIKQLNSEYHFKFRDGLYQGFCLCLDFKFGEFNEDTLNIINKRAKEIIISAIRNECIDCDMAFTGSRGFGICNFSSENKESLRKKFRECISTLQIQKELYPDVTFTIGIGFVTEDINDLLKSVLKAVDATNDRILVGNGKLIENIKLDSEIHIPTLVNNFSLLISSASEMFDYELVKSAIISLKDQVFSSNSICGREIFSLITLAGERIITQLESPENMHEILEEYSAKCATIGTANELFLALEKYAVDIVQKRNETHKYNESRPIRLAKQYIAENYMEAISLEDVAHATGFNTSYFSVFFKKGSGIGFGEYLSEVRINHAKTILKETNTPIYQVCEMVGYNDLKHFTKTFKKYTNLKPSEFRKLYG